jgi:hypothetical protein
VPPDGIYRHDRHTAAAGSCHCYWVRLWGVAGVRSEYTSLDGGGWKDTV